MGNHHWQQCYLHNNWKFGRPQARTSRQVFGYDVEFDGHRKSDTVVLWVVVVLAVAALFLEGWK